MPVRHVTACVLPQLTGRRLGLLSWGCCLTHTLWGARKRAAHVVSDNGCVAATVVQRASACMLLTSMDGSLWATCRVVTARAAGLQEACPCCPVALAVTSSALLLSLTLPEVPLDNEFVLLCVVSTDDQVVLTADEPVEALVPRRLAQHLQREATAGRVWGGQGGQEGDMC